MGLLLNHYALFLCPRVRPFNEPHVDDDFLADTRIELAWDEALFAAIGPPLEETAGRRCQPRRLPSNVTFRWLGDDGLQVRTCDARGNRLTYVPAGELADLQDLFGDRIPWNEAVHSLLARLPRESPIVLFWT
jgi:hypothetical protein